MSAQITLAGTAATRLLPTAGAGGAALTLWTLRRSGMAPRSAVRTLLTFFVLLYAVFLSCVVVAGALLALHLVASHGPTVLSAAPAAGAMLAIALALVFGLRRGEAGPDTTSPEGGLVARVGAATGLLGAAVRDACGLLRTRDARLAGAVAYWGFDAAVLWATLHAFGSPPALPVVALAYFVGQLANTLPLPGSVSGGIAGVLIAFGVSPASLSPPSWLIAPSPCGSPPRARWPPSLVSGPASRAGVTRATPPTATWRPCRPPEPAL